MSEAAAKDTELMRSLVDGDDSALAEIVGIWRKPLFAFILRYTQNEATTEELLQETFVRVYTKRELFKPELRFSSWIFTIAANLCRNHARWKKRHPESPLEFNCDKEGEKSSGEWSIPPDASPQPDSMASASEDLDLLKAAVGELPHEMRTTVLLHHFEGLSYKEIGEIVDCSPRGVETRLYRARKVLKKKLADVLEPPLRLDRGKTRLARQA